MPIVNLAINIPDGQLARVQAAARETWGASLTNAEIIERIRQKVVDDLRAMVKNTERRAAQIAADQLDPAIDVT